MTGIAVAPRSLLVRDKFVTDGQLQAVPFRRLNSPDSDISLDKCSTTLLSWGKKDLSADTTQINCHRD